MKPYYKLLLVILLLLKLPVAAFAQSIDTATINFIKVQHDKINKNLKSYRRLVKTDTAETTEGNEVALFFSGTEIKKITSSYYGETGKKINEYYFFNKKLILNYTVDYHYTVPISVNSRGKSASVKETRYYFKDGKIFIAMLKPISTVTPKEMSRLAISTQEEVQRLINLKEDQN